MIQISRVVPITLVNKIAIICCWGTIITSIFAGQTNVSIEDTDDTLVFDDQDDGDRHDEPRRITDIVVLGNKTCSPDVIFRTIPYKIGEAFNPLKTQQLINTLYNTINRFSNIIVRGKNVGRDGIILYIIVEEKPILKSVIIQGCNVVTEKEIRQKVTLDMPCIEEAELKIIGTRIKKLYTERGYCGARIDSEIQYDNDGQATVILTINESTKSMVKRICFNGNTCMSDKQLRAALLTQEDWLFGFLGRAGTFIPERLEADKRMIEQLYLNTGYPNARVIDIKQEIDPCGTNMTLTFEIEEGDLYRFGTINTTGTDECPEDYIVNRLPVRSGALYSRKSITEAMRALESFWGDKGYIFARIDPSIQTNEDEKTVDIIFNTNLGEKITLHKIIIKGNRKIREKVIRRRILLREGSLITATLMELSKNSVESLGYFDQRDGVTWKIKRIDATNANLELILKEVKTGTIGYQMGFGGAGQTNNSPSTGFNVRFNFSDRNLLGQGIDFNLEGTWSKQEQSLTFHMAQPWLFDKPLYGAIDAQYRMPSYDILRHIDIPAVNQHIANVGASIGGITRSTNYVFNDINILATTGLENIGYGRKPIATNLPDVAIPQYQYILNREFCSGTYGWVGGSLQQDTRNNPIHTSRGYRYVIASRIGLPAHNGGAERIGFYKFSLEGTWYTPIINEYDLVFRMRAFAGLVRPLAHYNAPFSELFNLGGPASVRGFLFGDIGPKFQGSPIGASKAFYWNFELQFPITADMSMKGAFFYDGGTGFDNPYVAINQAPYVQGNSFDYRHAVGFSLRVLNPAPVRIDWGFKLDPRTGESSSEIHFASAFDW